MTPHQSPFDTPPFFNPQYAMRASVHGVEQGNAAVRLFRPLWDMHAQHGHKTNPGGQKGTPARPANNLRFAGSISVTRGWRLRSRRKLMLKGFVAAPEAAARHVHPRHKRA